MQKSKKLDSKSRFFIVLLSLSLVLALANVLILKSFASTQTGTPTAPIPTDFEPPRPSESEAEEVQGDDVNVNAIVEDESELFLADDKPWVVFLVPHLRSENLTRSVEHMKKFASETNRDKILVYVADVDDGEEEDNPQICMKEFCISRRVLTESDFEIMNRPFDDPDWRKKTWQQMSDITLMMSLYLDNIAPAQVVDPVFFSLLDDDMSPCEYMEKHLERLAELGATKFKRKNLPYMIRVGPGTSGTLIPFEYAEYIENLLSWSLDGGRYYTRSATDDILDAWAAGEYREVGDVNPLGLFLYGVSLLDHGGDNDSHFLNPKDLENRVVSKCGDELQWVHVKRHPECKGQAFDPCPPDLSWAMESL